MNAKSTIASSILLMSPSELTFVRYTRVPIFSSSLIVDLYTPSVGAVQVTPATGRY